MNLKKIFSSVLATVLTVSAFAIGGATPAMAASTGISPGNTYAFQSTANTNYALNIFGTSTSQITNNRNVCLYQYDSNDIMQQWKVVSTSGGYRLQAAGGAVGYYLDRLSYGATSSNPLNNAQTYTASEDSIVNFESTNVENWVKIYQNVNGTRYYLTAVNCTNGTADGKSSTSPGNVYWAPESYSQSFQTWKVVPIGGGSSSGDIKIPSSKYTYISQQTYPWVNGAYGISTGTFQQTGCAVVAQAMFSQIMQNNPNITPEDMFRWGLAINSDGYPYATWTQNSSSPLNFEFSAAIGTNSWNTAKSTIYNQIKSGKPVMIHLNNTATGGTHFVVGYGLKAGATASNLTPSMVYVLDPWTSSNKTLQNTMNYSSNWSNFHWVKIAQ